MLTPPFQLRTLGRLALGQGRTEFVAVRRKPLCILAYLARQPGARASRAALATLFWPRSAGSRDRASLRQALSELREVLGPSLGADDQEVWIEPGQVELDASRFESHCAAGETGAAVECWGGDFLAGLEVVLEEDLRAWLEQERARLRRIRARAGSALVAAAESRGDWATALAHARAWAADLPDDDEAARRCTALAQLAQGTAGSTSPAGLGLLTPDLVGRGAEFATLTAIWHRVEQGQPGLVLIEGAAGSGKSRLMEDWLRWLRRQSGDPVILSVRAFDAERDRGFLVARHLFGRLAYAPGIVGAPPSALQALARVVPEFAERFPSLPERPSDDAADALARVLTEAATERRIVVAVDDAPLADQASLALLHALLRRPIPGVLLVLTGGTGELEVSEVERRGAEAALLQRCRLGPLTRAEVEQLLASMGAFPPDDRGALADRLWQETGGNPQGVVELTAALADAGVLLLDPTGHWQVRLPSPGAPLPVPLARQELVTSVLGRLDADERLVLEATAVLGRDATISHVLAVAGGDEQRHEAAADRLIRRRLLRPSGGPADEIVFGQPALRQAVYERLPRHRRRQLHRRAASVLGPTSSGESRTYHRAQAVAPGSRMRWLAVTLIAVLVGAVGLRVLLRPPPVAWRTAIGTFGSDSALAGGMFPELMALALEDAPGMELVGEPGGSPASFDAVGATHVVSGVARPRDDGIHLVAELRDRRTNAVVRRAQVAGSLDDLGTLASMLGAELARRGGRPGRNAFVLEAARTRSREALVSYLTGHRFAERLDMQSAAQAFWQATQIDAGFAAAWHGLSRVNAWFWLNDRSARMADSAVAHSRGLSLRDAQVISAWRALAHGDARSAEQGFRAILAYAPEFAEAHVGLAEVLHHFTWTQGRSRQEAGPEWDAAARLDPRDWRPVLHRFELAVVRGDAAQAERVLSAPSVVTSDYGSTRDERLILAALRRDSVEFRRGMAQFGDATEWSLAALAGNLAVLADNPWASEQVARLLTRPTRSGEVRALGHELLASLALAQGRWRGALAEADSAARLDPVSAATTRASLWISPFLPPGCRSDSGQRALDAALRAAPAPLTARTRVFWFDYDRARAPLLFPYFARLLALHSGTPTGEVLSPEPGPPPDSLTTLAPHLHASVRAWSSAKVGDTVAAVAALGDVWRGVDLSAALFSPASVRPWDLFLKAKGLASQGDVEGALGWYGALGVNGLADYSYVAPAALERARLLARLGRRDAAAVEYRRVIRLWGGADPEFEPLLAEARLALGLTP